MRPSLSVFLFAIFCVFLGSAVAACDRSEDAAINADPLEALDNLVRAECGGDGEPCERYGLGGICLASRCRLSGGACSYDQDCDDGNECSISRCERGACTVEYPRGTECRAGEGSCMNGACAGSPPSSCRADAQCRSAGGPCAIASCADSSCLITQAEDGALCRLPSNMYGRCEAGSCIIGEIEIDSRERCRTVRGHYGSHRQCEPRLRYGLSDEEIRREEKEIATRIKSSVLYDVDVSLIMLADGGYNIAVFNKHSRDDIRGLIDPSFIALEVASYTDSTDWKSRMLQVWTEVYEDGWQIPTSGGRKAVRKGQEASSLGYFGVVEIKSFRTWLQRSFLRMERAEPHLLNPRAGAAESTDRRELREAW